MKKYRAWKIEEVPVGEVLMQATERTKRALIVSVGQGGLHCNTPTSPGHTFNIAVGREVISAEQLLSWWFRADGSPCGILE